MTIKNILFALLWPITYASYGQGTTFNIVKALPYPQVDFSHIVLHNDTIVGYGTGFNDDIHWKQGVAVVKVDTFGNVLAHNFILDAKGDLLATSKAWGNIIRTSDSGYAAIAATVYRKSAFLIKLSHDLQVEFIKEYPDTVNRSNYFYKILETLEGYLLYGSIQRPDYYDDGFIRYVDKQGETVWFKYFEFSKFSTTVVHIQKIKDSTYIASFVSSSNKQEDIGFSSFMIFNLTSNEIMELGLWHFSIDSPVGINRRVIVTEGAILVFGLYRVSVINNVPIYRPILVRLDDSFRPVWVRHFGRAGSLNASILLQSFAPTIDGHYVGAGETLVEDGDKPSRRVGWLYKFSTEGDSIWERKIDPPLPPTVSGSGGFFGGVGVLFSGNIIAGGQTYEGNKRYCWLVKVTNDGCLDTLFCQPVSNAVILPSNQAPVEIFPHPVSGHLNIKAPAAIRQVTVFDALGHPVLQRQHLGTFARIDLPVQMPAGWYIVSLQDEAGNITSRRIYVQP